MVHPLVALMILMFNSVLCFDLQVFLHIKVSCFWTNISTQWVRMVYVVSALLFKLFHFKKDNENHLKYLIAKIFFLRGVHTPLWLAVAQEFFTERGYGFQDQQRFSTKWLLEVFRCPKIWPQFWLYWFILIFLGQTVPLYKMITFSFLNLCPTTKWHGPATWGWTYPTCRNTLLGAPLGPLQNAPPSKIRHSKYMIVHETKWVWVCLDVLSPKKLLYKMSPFPKATSLQNGL